ncbi:aminopeptidase N [uncultured Lentibacter sp.]|uniref:aminopeptidase N n=1 Tax=uncultured Lentibacter sp. TaxID=1659309 RepID=UPI00262CF742|nr:aminopeptidase N [uncultured Lentibacter sp.]
MSQAAPERIYLKDYKAFGWHLEEVHLTFTLDPKATKVKSRIRFVPNPDAPAQPFFLHGEGLELLSAQINGAPCTPVITPEGLTAEVPDGPFVWESEVRIRPAANTALEGLYMSNGMYCTQCEAEGFRKITYYPDRPDVMSVFTVRIEGKAPVLLSNGNPGASGAGFAEWHDPWPKPAYLFALVAGDLVNHPDSFTTRSGRDVALNIWVRPGDEDKCAFGMEALKKSMAWDETAYGREYDLDVFNIVAVDDFNMGAMENKGLNIFNSSCVLASPQTSTDDNFERIEAIIAHEYFHNWTGNRITCRDWFQLCLKEGLTVFRDSQFTADMRSAPVKRITDVIDLRNRQFREDNGPLAHPVRPDSFVEINNFYTATVYEKGAELIGMLKRLVGDTAYDAALALYFERHDGQACTLEDWLKVFEDVTGESLAGFKLWYTSAGTPRLFVREAFEAGRYTLTFTQETPPTPGEAVKAPRVIPIAVGLLGADGREILPTTMLKMTDGTQSFHFEGLPERPVPSILRDFSAPVILTRATSSSEQAFLLAHDTDPFNKWQAADSLRRASLMASLTEGRAPDSAFLEAMAQVVSDERLDPAFRALVLRPANQDELAQELHSAGQTPDPDAIYLACETLAQSLAQHLADSLPKLYAQTTVTGPYRPDAEGAGKRALNGRVLGLLTRMDGGAQARAQFATANNMTQQLAALTALLAQEDAAAELAAFEAQWQQDRLVMDKWFGVQVALAAPQTAASLAETLTEHPLFEIRNPNRFRAVFGGLALNHAGFHHASGQGYRVLADWLIKLDALNPQTAARLCAAFQTSARYAPARSTLAQAALARILASPDLSRDTTEMVTRILEV